MDTEKKQEYPCTFCPVTFFKKADLGKHMVHVHYDKVVSAMDKIIFNNNSSLDKLNVELDKIDTEINMIYEEVTSSSLFVKIRVILTLLSFPLFFPLIKIIAILTGKGKQITVGRLLLALAEDWGYG